MTVLEFSTVFNLLKQLLPAWYNGLIFVFPVCTILLRIWAEILEKKLTWIYIYRNIKMKFNAFFQKINVSEFLSPAKRPPLTLITDHIMKA